MSKGKILVADDEPYVQRALSFVLRKEGYEVETASDGDEAVRKFEVFLPDVVFLDLTMPNKDGYEVCHLLKNDPKYRGISPYIVMLTCKSQEIDRYNGYIEGVNEYTTKPFSPLEVIEKMRTYFATKRNKINR